MHGPSIFSALIFLAAGVAGQAGRPEKSPPFGVFLAQPMAMAEDEAATKSLCANYTKLYLQELRKFTLWAVQMYDSTAKVPEGVISGNVYQFGHYDGCLKIKVDLGDGDGFRGKHCLAKIKFAPKPESYSKFFVPSEDPYRMHFDSNESAWEKIKYTGDLRKQRRDEIFWGVCVPSVCNANSVANAIRNAIKPLQSDFGINANVELKESNCNVDKALTLDALDLSYGSFLITIVAIVLACTLFDTYTGYTEKTWDSFGMRILRSFSIKSNWMILVQGPAPRDNDAGDLRSIHGIRFFSMLLIILGHRCMFSLGGPLFNPERIEQIYTSAANMILLNGTIIVDTFFLISGFLSCYLMLLELDKKKKVNVPLIYAYRYIRLTPVYLMVIGFYATIFVKLGDGPLWEQKVGLDRDRCRANWWANILYINNYVNPENMCLFQSWFLTCDMHLFLLSPMIIYPLWKWPIPGKMLLSTITALSIFVPFAVTYLGGLDAVLLLFMTTLADPVSNETFRSIYIPTHTRAAPYIIGMVWGYVLYRLRKDAVKINKKLAAGLFVFLHLVAFGCIFGAWAFYIPDIPRSALEKALYGGLHRAGWAISIGWLIVACALNLAGPYRALLSWKPLVPLGRLTYCAFLVHGGVQLFQTSTMRIPEYMTYFKLFWMTLGDISFTFGTALVLFMLFEAPVSSLEKIFMKKGPRPASNNQELPVTLVPSDIRAPRKP